MSGGPQRLNRKLGTKAGLSYDPEAQPLPSPSRYQTILYVLPLLSTATPFFPSSDSTCRTVP